MFFCICIMASLQILIVVVAEARVYCQDSHATPWVPLGYSCPIVCQNIINAIERLKIMDFEDLIYQKPQLIPGLNSKKPASKLQIKDEKLNEIETAGESIDDEIYRTNKIKRNKEKLFKNRTFKGKDNYAHNTDKISHRKFNANSKNHSVDNEFYKDVIKLSQLAAKTFKGNCFRSKKADLIGLIKCARKSNIDGSFLIIMTQLLNKYANSVYKFTEEMTEVLLQKIFGENTDLRNNIFDVNKLLGYLRQALHRHKEHERRDIIALRPTNCLTVSLPGCYCQSGFVESSGQCVKPEDCLTEPSYADYLTRVVVS